VSAAVESPAMAPVALGALSLEEFLVTRLAHEQSCAASPDDAARFRAIIDALPAAVYTTDGEGRITHFNPACIELSGRVPTLGSDHWCVTWKLFTPSGEPLPHADCPMAVALREGRAIRGAEAIAERPDGSRIWFTPFPTPLKDAAGKVIGGINMLLDITDRKRNEELLRRQTEELAELHRRKDEFLAMLSHELRNPLAPIAHAVQFLKLDESLRSGPAHQARAIIERQVKQLSRIVDDLLEVSRITTGRIPIKRELIDARSVIERAAEASKPVMSQREHHFAVELPAGEVWLHADAVRLEQILVNLLNNAAKYTDARGSVVMSAEVADNWLEIRVRDTGQGIAAELLPHIFQLFTQAERTLDRSEGGLGIGLALVDRLVKLHGGSVDVTSTVGRGSEFIVKLPVVVSTPWPSPARAG
jgi:signal transduction histidine kinase